MNSTKIFPQKSGRKLPQTTTIIHNENSALKNKVKMLEESLKQSYSTIQTLIKEKELLKSENKNILLKHEKEINKLKKEKKEVEEVLEYREEFIKEHCM